MRHSGGRASPEAWREPLLGGLVNFAYEKYRVLGFVSPGGLAKPAIVDC